MPGDGPEETQNPLIHEGAEPDRDHDSHAVADRRANVVQPTGEPLEDTVDEVPPKEASPKSDEDDYFDA